jgi:polysaccharide export outer membrane protein
MQTAPTLHDYLVDADGYVVIPNIGKVQIAGKTISEAEQLIFEKAKSGFASTPVVVVRFINFKISVLGEVAAPGSYIIKNGKVTILEALALARDLTIYGQRENVKIVRESANGERTVAEVDLNDASLLASPYYYLQQNDVVYVTPNESKAKNSDIGSSTSLWFSGTSILISLASLLYNILK